MMLSGSAIFLTFWNYNNFDNFLVTRLYRRLAKDDEKMKDDGEVMAPTR